MVSLTKNYSLLRFLNKSHGPIVTTVAGSAAWLLSVLSTGSMQLANHVRQQILAGDFKTGLRQLHWLTSRSWLHLYLIEDRFFDFTQGMGRPALAAVQRFIDRSGSHEEGFTDATNKLYVLARDAHLALELGDTATFRARHAAYLETFQVAYQLLKDIAPSPVARTAKSRCDFSKNDARTALSDFERIMRAGDLPWYVISGTFLGLIREGGWLDHDYDIDIGVHAEEVTIDQVISIFQNSMEFVIRKIDHQTRIVGLPDNPKLECVPAMVKLVHVTGMNVDVFFHHLEGDLRWHGSSLHRWNNREFALQSYNLDGVSVLGPTDADRYLTENYGDWRTPVTEFNCSTGTPNLVPVANLYSPALFLKRMGAEKAEGNSRLVSQLVDLLRRQPPDLLPVFQVERD